MPDKHERARTRFLSGSIVTVLAMFLGITLLAPRPTYAQEAPPAQKPVLVILLRPVPAGEVLNEAFLRVRSELVAGGFDVAMVDSGPSDVAADPWSVVEHAGQDLAPSATIGIFGDLEQGKAELWVADRITGKTVVRRLDVQASPDRRISEILAIRALELLRASLLECLIKADQTEPSAQVPPPRQVQNWVKDALDSRSAPWTLGLEVGSTVFGGLGGMGLTVAPAARLRLALGEQLWTRISAVGLGTSPRVETTLGSAEVSQDILLVEITYWLRPRHYIRPLLSLGLGAERFAVDGTAILPYQGEHLARWFAAGDAGGGVAFRLRAHWEVQFEVHALFTTPRPAVRFFDVQSIPVGQPTLLAVLTLAGGA